MLLVERELSTLLVYLSLLPGFIGIYVAKSFIAFCVDYSGLLFVFLRFFIFYQVVFDYHYNIVGYFL